MKALIVESDVMSQCVLAKLLTERGHEVVAFENAEQAILAYQKDFYPLLCVAAELPGMDGLQFSRWIRSQPNGDRVFIIVGASPGEPADLSQVLEAGANDFMGKPYELSAIGARLTIAEKQMDQFFSQTRLQQALAAESTEKSRLASELQEMLDVFEQRSKEYETQLVSARETCDTETNQRQRLQTDLETTRRELSSRLAELEAQLAQAQAALVGEEESRAELQSRLIQLEKESEETLRARESALAELEDARRVLEEEKRERQKDNDLATAAACELNTRLEAETQRRVMAEKGLEEIRSARTEAADEAQQELARARQRHIEDQERIAGLTEELGGLTGMVKRLTEEAAIHRDARQHVAARYRALVRLSRQVNDAQTPAEIGRVVADRARDLVGWDRFRFDVYSSQTNRVTPVVRFETGSDAGAMPGDAPESIVPDGFLRRVMDQGPQLIVQPSAANGETAGGDASGTASPSSTLCVPVRSGNRVAGFISLSTRAFNAYSLEDVEAAGLLAAQAAAGLERLRGREVGRDVSDYETEFAPSRF